MTKTITSEDLKVKLLEGIKKLSEAVTSTLGPGGRNVIIKNEDGTIRITKDGVTVAQSFKKLEDPVADLGVQLVKKVSKNSAIKAGDGTTTSTLLAYEIAKMGFYQMKIHNFNAVEVKKGIEKASREVVEYLQNLSQEITDIISIRQVASISANNDEEIGKLIASAFEEVGRDGIVTIQESKTGETYLEVVEGMMLDRGMKSLYFVTNNDNMTAVLEDALILAYNGRITSAKQLLPLFEYATTEQSPLLIIAEEIDDEALATLIVNKVRGMIKVVAIKAPDYGERRLHILEDIATITGATVLSREKGHVLDNIKPTQYRSLLGKARTVISGRDSTTVVDGKGSEDEIKKRLLELKFQIEKAESAFEKERLQERLGKLTGGVAIIHIGGFSDVEIKEKHDRVEDSIFSTRYALDYGILPGGGIALINAGHNLSSSPLYSNESQEMGKEIVKHSLKQPFYKMLINSGVELKDIGTLFDNIDIGQPWNGYDIKTMGFGNMKEMGIIDSTRVVITALENAASVAGTILTTEAAVYEEKEEDSNIDMNPQMYM